MLIYDLVAIGNKMLNFRKRLGLTQAEIAEMSGLSDRTYADIERGNTNMRIETLLKICDALHITPDQLLTEESQALDINLTEIMEKLDICTPQDKATALQLLSVYLKSLD